MKELKFKEVGVEYSEKCDEYNEIKIKPYLTWDEYANIYKSVSAQDNSFMRNFSKVVEFAKECTNIKFDGMSDKEIYDICAKLRLIGNFEFMIDEYNLLDRMIERDENTYNALTQIIEVIDKKLDGFDVNKIQEGLLNLGGELENVKGNK